MVAIASLFPFMRLLEWPPSGADWLRRVPLAIESLLFVVVWFALLDLFSARADDPTAGPPPELGRRPGRFAGRAMLAGAMLWTAALGFLGGAFMDFGGDGEYRPVSSVPSPQGNMRADVVVYLEPGGALTGIASEIYLLPASKSWSPRHRGLLIWRARGIHVDGVVWESDRAVRVRALNSAYRSAKEYSHAFTRRGFTARTEVVPGS